MMIATPGTYSLRFMAADATAFTTAWNADPPSSSGTFAIVCAHN